VPPAVEARGLTKRYGDFVAVDGVDLRVEAGECFGLLGPNGAGKTTTMRMLACLAPRDGGDLGVLGIDPEEHPRELKRMLGARTSWSTRATSTSREPRRAPGPTSCSR
jgi:lipooligosaccharide transport system ATP-binding protein